MCSSDLAIVDGDVERRYRLVPILVRFVELLQLQRGHECLDSVDEWVTGGLGTQSLVAARRRVTGEIALEGEEHDDDGNGGEKRSAKQQWVVAARAEAPLKLGKAKRERVQLGLVVGHQEHRELIPSSLDGEHRHRYQAGSSHGQHNGAKDSEGVCTIDRSEERRVGKECA